MKKMKAVALAHPAAVCEDPRVRFRHESLMQDYDELLKETEAKRKRMEVMEQRRTTLMAEVRFLRRRFNHLTEKQTTLQSQLKKSRKVKSNSSQPVPKLDMNRKGLAVHSGKELVIQNSIDLNHKQKKSNKGRREASKKNTGSIPDLNGKGRTLGGKDSSTDCNNARFFDLNQISMEEEESQTNGETMMARMEKPNFVNSLQGGFDEQRQHSDLQFSACRNMGNGSSQGGKRKISWQDPVALRV